MKKILLVILVVALAAPAVGFKDDDKTKVMPRMGGAGYCGFGDSTCKNDFLSNECVEAFVMPPNVTRVEYSSSGGQCGSLDVYFDGGDYTLIECWCAIW